MYKEVLKRCLDNWSNFYDNFINEENEPKDLLKYTTDIYQTLFFLDKYSINKSDKELKRCFEIIRLISLEFTETFLSFIFTNNRLFRFFKDYDYMRENTSCLLYFEKKEDDTEHNIFYHYIMNDDVESVIELGMKNPDIDFKRIELTSHLKDICRDYISLAAFFGAEKCFRFFYNLHFSSDDFDKAEFRYKFENIIHNSYIGGNLKIIKILNPKKFAKYTGCAIENFNNDLVEYIGSNYSFSSSFIENALRVNNLPVMKLLLERSKVDIFKGVEGRTFLDICISVGNKDGCEILLTKYEEHHKLNDALSLINNKVKNNMFLERGYKDLYQMLYNGGFFPEKIHKNKLLIGASENGHLYVVKYFLAIGADPECSFNKKLKPIHFAAKTSSKICETLVEYKADFRSCDLDGGTPIHHSSFSGKCDCIEFFLRLNCDINAIDSNYQTPLHSAVKGNSLEAVQLLVNNGSRIDIRDKEERTPLDLASNLEFVEIENFLRRVEKK